MFKRSENIQKSPVTKNSNTNASELTSTTTITQVTPVITLLNYKSSELEELYISTPDLPVIV